MAAIGPAEERHPPPAWNPAPEGSHTLGLFNEASDDDWERADAFCTTHPPTPPKLLASDVIDRIRVLGCAAWGLERPADAHFIGHIERSDQTKSGSSGGDTWKVRTEKRCRDSCVMSELPLMAGLYDIHGRRGVYYEARVNKMDGVVAIGTSPERNHILQHAHKIPSTIAANSIFNSNRYGMQTIPVLASARVEPSERRLAPGRSTQVLRRSRRRPGLRDRRARRRIRRTFSNFSWERRRLRLRVRHRGALLHPRRRSLAKCLCGDLHAACGPRRLRCDRL